MREPEQLIYLTFPTDSAEGTESETFSDPVFVAMRDAARGHAALFAMSTQVMRPVRFDGPTSEKEQVRTQYGSGGRAVGYASVEVGRRRTSPPARLTD